MLLALYLYSTYVEMGSKTHGNKRCGGLDGSDGMACFRCYWVAVRLEVARLLLICVVLRRDGSTEAKMIAVRVG